MHEFMTIRLFSVFFNIIFFGEIKTHSIIHQAYRHFVLHAVNNRFTRFPMPVDINAFENIGRT